MHDADEVERRQIGDAPERRHRDDCGHVHQARQENGAPHAEARRDRPQPMAAIEIEVLARIQDVEPADPEADRQTEQPRLRARPPPAAIQPPTGATAIASPRNNCVYAV